MQTHEGLFTSSSLGPSIPDTAEQGLEPPKWVTAGFFIGWSRGFPEGMEELGWSRGFSTMGVGSVVFLIWDYLPRTLRTFCSFSL